MNKKKLLLIFPIAVLLIIALAVGGYFFYQNYYLQPIHTLTLEGAEDRLQVQLTADIDETYLRVVCADSHGNSIPAPVVGGKAVFSGLAPDTAYTVSSIRQSPEDCANTLSTFPHCGRPADNPHCKAHH